MTAFPYTLDPEQIPTAKVVDVTHGGVINYGCPVACWDDHMKAWRRELTHGNKTAPRPFSTGHCMFENPTGYGCVAYGDTSPESLRQAWEAHVRGDLTGGGWLRDVPEARAEAIIKATVAARMEGVELGAAPYLACVGCWLDE